MADNKTHTQFTGSIPQKYDEHLGPLLFDFYAQDLARRVKVPTNGRVLEVASGTGISTEKLRAELPQSVEIIATDLNPAMLDYAKSKRGNLSNVKYQVADATALPFQNAEFDAVVCQYGIMFFPDKLQGLREFKRVLKPRGQIVFNTWGSIEANPIIGAARDVISQFFKSDPPRFLEIPFGYNNIDAIKATLTEAGFESVQADVVKTEVSRPSAQHVAIGLVEGNPGIHEINERGTSPASVVIEEVTAALKKKFGDNPLRTQLQAIVFTAQSP